jgi:hypothetical protein
MAIQLSETVRNARLDVVESTISTTPTMEIRTGAAPANCAASDTGTLLASITLPSDWMAAASGGAKAKSGTWEDSSADGTGTAGHFRIKQSTTCHIQGTCGASGSGADMIIDNPSLVTGQPFTVQTFTLTDANA